MTITKRSGLLVLSALTVLMMSWLPVVAQDPVSKTAVPAKKKQDRARRVPDYFGQIGLTEQQRTKIYAIQGKRYEKIEALEQQIVDEKAGMLAECDGVLTDVQKKLLENLRKAAADPAVKSAPTPKTAN